MNVRTSLASGCVVGKPLEEHVLATQNQLIPIAASIHGLIAFQFTD